MLGVGDARSSVEGRMDHLMKSNINVLRCYADTRTMPLLNAIFQFIPSHFEFAVMMEINEFWIDNARDGLVKKAELKRAIKEFSVPQCAFGVALPGNVVGMARDLPSNIVRTGSSTILKSTDYHLGYFLREIWTGIELIIIKQAIGLTQLGED